MKAFMDENFLLETPTAQKLFHEYASQVPVLDYHCHINPQEIPQYHAVQCDDTILLP